MENFETDLPTGHLGTATLASIGVKLDKASEAIRVLDETRTFWTRTWDEADACPAMEQNPLFDAANTVEMTLDFLETIHPAILLCQVMAVNLAMAYFTLVVSAEDAVMVGVVRTSLVRLRESVVNALGLLSQDATQGERTSFEVEGSSLVSIVSIDSLAACGRACIHLSEAEVQVSRAKSLLHKLPKQTKLVDKIMRQPNGARTEVVDSARRRAILNSIAQRQLGLSTVGSTAVNIEPKPTMREYILRNNDDLEPCQLCVKYNDENPRSPNEECADILVALTLTERHKID